MLTPSSRRRVDVVEVAPPNHGRRIVQVRLKAVARVDALLDLLVLVRVLLGLADHALDVLLGQAALLGRDGDLLGLARALVLGGHLEDAVRVDLEGHLDLGHAPRRRRDAGQLELAEPVRSQPVSLMPSSWRRVDGVKGGTKVTDAACLQVVVLRHRRDASSTA